MGEIKVGDKVKTFGICESVSGVVIKQYYPTACAEQTMIRTDDGRLYHAPTVCFVKI